MDGRFRGFGGPGGGWSSSSLGGDLAVRWLPMVLANISLQYRQYLHYPITTQDSGKSSIGIQNFDIRQRFSHRPLSFVSPFLFFGFNVTKHRDLGLQSSPDIVINILALVAIPPLSTPLLPNASRAPPLCSSHGGSCKSRLH